ncbi:glycosyltransferase 87 family protein [Shewanella woodyi]|uniref:glycosyltransferase 87 family protein n=1 Tax=Shewanella woodyi TaxID=60961 RepID=UPI0007EB1290|nr:glycosyltransferase 87 family protein [Shewanella woodyi]
MKNIAYFNIPYFKTGLLIRIVLIVFLAPEIQTDWFLPFISHFIDQPSFDPWSDFLLVNENYRAYPYGFTMLFSHTPLVLLGSFIDDFIKLSFFENLGLKATILIADFIVFSLLVKLYPNNSEAITTLYWLSPIVLFVNYWNGQTDIIPVAILLYAITLTKKNHMIASGLTLALAVTAKHSMLIVIPFFAIYLYKNKRYRRAFFPFLFSFFSALVLLIIPAIFSSGFVEMVLNTPETERIYHFAIPLGPEINIYVTPIIYVLLLYSMWRISWISFDVLMASIGLGFFALILLTPSPVGWYLWLLPFLIGYLLKKNEYSNFLFGTFTFLIICYHSMFSFGAQINYFEYDLIFELDKMSSYMNIHSRSLWVTLITTFGGLLSWRLLREEILKNKIYLIGTNPIAIGISGDSGAGKDTFGASLAGLFGKHSVSYVSGDDYHVWDRYGGMWNALTHLNPSANYIHKFCRDILALLERKSIYCRTYEHTTGLFSEPKLRKGNNVLIASGLHTLFSKSLSDKFDVRVFLEPSDQLRYFWKYQRDVNARGSNIESVSASLKKRQSDAQRYIHPQKKRADIIFQLIPLNQDNVSPFNPEQNFDDVRLKLQVTIKGRVYYERLSKVLIGLCGISLEKHFTNDNDNVTLTIEGDVFAEDMSLAIQSLNLTFTELLDIYPVWKDGMLGLMQIITILHLDETMRVRKK